MTMFEKIITKEGMTFLGWRKVETHKEVLGTKAIDAMPYIMQGFVKKPDDCEVGLLLIVFFIKQEEFLNRVMKILMYVHYLAVLLYIKVCSL